MSNEGGSSGGHTAIRFDEDVYHFQAEDGQLVLRRDRADEFLFAYTLLGNRTIHSTRVAVSPETYGRLVERFRRRHRAQEAQRAVDEALRRDREWLEQLARLGERGDGSSVAATLPIRGLGYFDLARVASSDADRRSRASQSSSSIRTLREHILREHGPAAVADRRSAILEAMRALAAEPPTKWSVVPPDSAYAYPAFSVSYTNRWRDLAAGLAALEVLEGAPPLAEAAHHAPTDADFALSAGEVEALGELRDALRARLAALIRSKRADWGQTLLVGMARLNALERSIETSRLVVLDAFPDDAEILEPIDRGRRAEIGAQMLLENRKQLERSRRYLERSSDRREIAWERVEERSNRTIEIRRALRDGGRWRVARGHLVPAREAPYPLPTSVLSTLAPSDADLRDARRRQRAYTRDLRRLHRYGLLDQNCATALFETLNDSFDDSVRLTRESLGGYVPSRGSLAFIPFVSARAVSANYRVVTRETIPSYRDRRLREMREQEPALRVAFRESNTFTSRTYERSPSDSFFVFFTDGQPLLRPLFGLVNLTAALGQSTLGIVTAPVDRGANLVKGLRGTFVSLVELGFSNIRKGSNDWIPERYRDTDPIAEPNGREGSPGR